MKTNKNQKKRLILIINTKSNNNKLSLINKKNELKNTQNLPELYHDAGQFYWGKKKAWLAKKNIFRRKSSIHLINYLDSHDVDTNEDWSILKKLYNSPPMKRNRRNKSDKAWKSEVGIFLYRSFLIHNFYYIQFPFCILFSFDYS